MKFVTAIMLLQLTVFAACITPRKGPRKSFAKAAALKPFDAIIVPGIPYNGASWDSVMKARVLWSYILYKNGYARNVIYSGGAIYTPYIEAQVMGAYGEALGIPAANIFLDSAARHSTENVYHSYLLSKELGFKSVALATDPFQAFMLRAFTRKRFSSPIYHLPLVVDSIEMYRNLRPIVDVRHLRKTNWRSIKDQQGIGERIRGTMGRGIDWERYPEGKAPAL